MSTVELTKAETSGLQYIRGDHECMPTAATFGRLHDRGLCTPGGGQLTPRGHAALAAPRMTKAELALLTRIGDGSMSVRRGERRVALRLNRRRLALYDLFDETIQIVDAGRIALNNVRAAMGSPDWKED